MDIQELLSDSGIGREMHVIVGQGQLAAILESKPEERRAFIEEAAGVLKHRKRKEKALRKLEAMQANLTRLTDLTARTAPPAQAARQAGRDRPPRAGRPVRAAGREAAPARRRPGDAARRRSRRRSTTRRRPASAAPRSRSRCRSRSTSRTSWRNASPPTRRSCRPPRTPGTGCPLWRNACAAPSGSPSNAPGTSPPTWTRPRGGRDPDELDREAEETAEMELELQEGVTEARIALAEAVETRAELERMVSAGREGAHRRRARDRRPPRGPGPAVRSGGSVAQQDERDRRGDRTPLRHARRGVRTRRVARRWSWPRPARSPAPRTRTTTASTNATARPCRPTTPRRQRVEELVKAERTAERDIASWRARVDALSLGLTRKDGAGALLASGRAGPAGLGRRAADRRAGLRGGAGRGAGPDRRRRGGVVR